MFLFLILGILLGILAVIFALQNIVPVTVMFLSWELHGSMAFVIAMAIVAGLLISILVSIPEVVSNYFTLKSLRKRNQELEAEALRYRDEANALAANAANAASRNSFGAAEPLI